MSAKKIVTLVLCMVLVAALSVAGTLAYLTSTDEVVNTFTYGKIEIKMDETDVDEYGVKDGDTRNKANTYKLIPGHKYTKDPIVYVKSDSENSYLFVQVVNEIASIEADTNTIAAQIEKYGWTLLEEGGNVYWKLYDKKTNPEEEWIKVPVFDEFTIKGTINNTTVENYNSKSIKVTAYAIQADGFAGASAAWAAYGTQHNNSGSQNG